MRVENVPIDSLRCDPANARKHSKRNIDAIAGSLTLFGQRRPLVCMADGTVVAGNGTLEACSLLGWEKVAVTRVPEDWTPEQAKAYALADNRTAELAVWDEDVLGLQLAELEAADFDIAAIGFDALPTDGGDVIEDEAPEPPADPVTKPGDLWLLGDHRVLCGDSTKAEDVARLCNGVVPDLANCDPPYGVNIVNVTGGVRSAGDYPFGGVGGAKPFGKQGRVHGPAANAIIKPGVYAPIIGDDSTDTALASYGRLVEIGVPAIVMWGGNYYADALPASRRWLVWDKDNTGSFADGELAWTNQDATVRILRHQWSGLIKASERGEKRVHPTQKPVVLAQWVIDTCAPESKTVLDLFLGSGWTLSACEQSKRTCYGMELSPAYCDVIVKRWENLTGKKAVLSE